MMGERSRTDKGTDATSACPAKNPMMRGRPVPVQSLCEARSLVAADLATPCPCVRSPHEPKRQIMTSKLAERISEIPKLYETGDKSTASLLKDTGYPERREPVTVEDVETVLKREPDLIDLWLKRCQDQRLAGGWGIE